MLHNITFEYTTHIDGKRKSLLTLHFKNQEFENMTLSL